MKAKQRIDKIIEKIPYNGFIMVKELSQIFGVTEETIRRDLNKIVKLDEGIRKVHGGAYRVESEDSSVPQGLRQSLLIDEKSRFANVCISLIKPDSCIMLDSSTTALYIAKRIKAENIKVTIITNSLLTTREFEDSENVFVICVGGVLRKRNGSLVGNTTVSALENYCADCSFISPTSVNMEFGLTDNNYDEAQVRKAMIKHSNKHFLVADHTKLGRMHMHFIDRIEKIDMVITDMQASKEWLDFFEKKKIQYKCC